MLSFIGACEVVWGTGGRRRRRLEEGAERRMRRQRRIKADKGALRTMEGKEERDYVVPGNESLRDRDSHVTSWYI
jgi:hypothetical protein